MNVINASTPSMAVVDPQDLVGQIFLMDECDDGQHFQAKIVECIHNHESAKTQTSDHVKFWCSVNDDAYEDLISYNEMMDYVQKNAENNQILWWFKCIIGHQGPLKPSDHHYMGSHYNIQVKWENGEITYEPLFIIAKDDCLSCAVCAGDNDLLEVPGWKQLRCLAWCKKHLLHLVKQAKMQSFKNAPQYKFGIVFPMTIEKPYIWWRTWGHQCQDATNLAMQQLKEYECFMDAGVYGKDPPPEAYKKIRVRLIFDVKHDGRHKSRLVASRRTPYWCSHW